MPKAKVNIGSDIRGQFTSAQRIVRELSKYGAATRSRILDIVNEHQFDEAPAADDKTGDLFGDAPEPPEAA